MLKRVLLSHGVRRQLFEPQAHGSWRQLMARRQQASFVAAIRPCTALWVNPSGREGSDRKGKGVLLTLLGLIGLGATGYDRQVLSEEAHPRGAQKIAPQAASKPPGYHSRNFIADATEKAFPALVNILVPRNLTSRMLTASTGSGFIISDDGFIVTNAHVVAGQRGQHVEVTRSDGETFIGKVHSMDTQSDLALIKIDPPVNEKLPVMKLASCSDQELHVIRVSGNLCTFCSFWHFPWTFFAYPILQPQVLAGSSANLRVGEWVIALGSPLSLQNSVSVGVVSAVARHSSELGLPRSNREFIQTDAAINSGNSGGPLINVDGEVIGINAIKLASASGVSFAIPIDTAWPVIDQLRRTGRVCRPYVGMTMISLSKRDPELQVIISRYPDVKAGVIVFSISPASPAERAGLRKYDVIVEFEGKPVTSTRDIYRELNRKIYEGFTLKVRRLNSSEPVTINVQPTYTY